MKPLFVLVVLCTAMAFAQNEHQRQGDRSGDESQRTFNVSNVANVAWMIDGNLNPTLTLQRGTSYVFDVNARGHPFWIKTAKKIGNDGAYFLVENNGFDIGKDFVKRRRLNARHSLLQLPVPPPHVWYDKNCRKCARVSFTLAGKRVPCWRAGDCVAT
jgi:hypothetical protein